MTPSEILPGHVYEARRPKAVGIFDPLLNDRTVHWISSERDFVQYNSPTVKAGRRLPIVSMEKFCRWAGRDVTSLMPLLAWRSARDKKRRESLDRLSDAIEKAGSETPQR